MNLNHVLSMALSCAALAALAGVGRRLTLRTIVGLGVALLCLPLCGANGLPIVLAGSVWLAGAAIAAWRRGEPAERRLAWLALVVAAAALALVVGYFVGFYKVAAHPTPSSLCGWLVGSVKALSISVVPWKESLWPWSVLVAPAFLLAAGMWLIHVAWTQREQRLCAVGLLAFLAAAAGVALAIGWGRSELGITAITTPRYGIITLPVLLGVYVAWTRCAAPRCAQLVPMALFALFCLTLQQQMSAGLATGRFVRDASAGFNRDLRAGAPAEYLARRFAYVLYAPQLSSRVEMSLNKLRDLEYGRFRRLGRLPDQTESVPLAPALVHDLSWRDGAGDALGPDPHLVYRLEQPRHVAMARLRCVLTKPGPPLPTTLQVFWAQRGRNSISPLERVATFLIEPKSEEQSVFVWINDAIDELRVDPDTMPAHFELRGIELIIAENEQRASVAP
jgi:hypothetical protein